MAEPLEDVRVSAMYGWLFSVKGIEGFSIRQVYQGVDGHFHDLQHDCGVQQGWFMERMGPNIGVDLWLDCPDCGRNLERLGLAFAFADQEFCRKCSEEQVDGLIAARKATMSATQVDATDTDTDTDTDAVDAWEEYVDSMRADKREQLEDEYLEEMSAVVDERIREWVADLENDERAEFIERYREEHPDDDDDDDDDD